MRRTASSPRTPTAPGRASASWMTDLVPATDETEEWVDAPRRPNTCPRNPRHPRWQRRRLRRSCVVASAALSTTVPLWASSSSATSAAFAAAFTGDRSPDAGDRFRFPTAAQAKIGLPSRASWPGASGLPPGRRKMRKERDFCWGGCSAEPRVVSVAGSPALGGVGDPVVVELEDVVGRGDQS